MASYHLFRGTQHVGHASNPLILRQLAQVGDYAFIQVSGRDCWYKYSVITLQCEEYKNFTGVTENEVPESTKLALLLVI